MRENRQSGSEGGVVQTNAPSLPLRAKGIPEFLGSSDVQHWTRIGGMNVRGAELLRGGARTCSPLHRPYSLGARIAAGISAVGRVVSGRFGAKVTGGVSSHREADWKSALRAPVSALESAG
jgi:hypothetical protein